MTKLVVQGRLALNVGFGHVMPRRFGQVVESF